MIAALAVCGPAWAEASGFHALLAMARQNPAVTDWAAVRAAWAASAAYDPFVGSTPLQAGMDAAVDRGDFALASSLAEQALKPHWLDLAAQMQAAAAYQGLGQTARAALHQRVAHGLLQAILATGNGRAFSTAFHVLAQSEELAVAQDARVHVRGQRRLHQDGHWYDVLTVRHLSDKKLSETYFEVDELVAREVWLEAGTQAVDDAEAP